MFLKKESPLYNKIDFNDISNIVNIKKIIKDYPEELWDWEWLIKNTDVKIEECIPFNLIEKFYNNCNCQNLSHNLNLSEEFILKHPDKHWNIYYLIKNNKITDFNALSKFKYLNEYIINKYPNKPWDWDWIIKNTRIKIIEHIPINLFEKYKWISYYSLSKNLNLTEEFILKHPDEDWNIKYLIKNNKITNFNALSKFKNITQNIINQYPNKPWDWEWLKKNTNIEVEKYISIDLFEKYKWTMYYSLSENLNLTEEFILKHPDKNWDIEYLIKNNKITDFNALSKFKYLNQDILYNYLDKPWDWKWLIENSNIKILYFIPLDIIEKYLHNFNYSHIQNNKNITEEFILKYPDKSWDIKYLIENNKITDFKALSKFKNINQSIINKYPNKPWDWEWLIENTNIYIEEYISLDLIEKYKYKWNYWKLSYNPNLTEEIILKYSNKCWNINYLIDNNKITDFKALSKFKYLLQNIINAYLDKPWDWEWLIENTNNKIGYYISLDLIEKYISLDLFEKYKNKWDYKYLSYNPNLTEEYILKYPYQNWSIEYLIKNNKITDFKALSKFKDIFKNTIDKYPNKPWDWEWLIENTDVYVEKHIPLNLIEKYKNRFCYSYVLSFNPNLTEEFILKHPYKTWNIEYLIDNNKITDFKALSKFKYINQNIINKYPDKPWDWEWLIENTNIHVEEYIPLNLIEKYISIAMIKKYIWKWELLSKNSNIIKEFILKHPNKNWDTEYLIKNNKITDSEAKKLQINF